jgi:hypothetical protein
MDSKIDTLKKEPSKYEGSFFTKSYKYQPNQSCLSTP